MCVPLWNNREIIGLIYSDREALHGQFTEEDLRLLTVLANLAALKIENTRLFEESLEKARMEQELVMAQKIQRNLMPQGNPVFEPFDITGNNWPCRHIGGDYFDFIPMDPSALGIVIADVSGHGVGAAFLMASLRASLYALLPSIKDLAILAATLNDIVYGDSDDDHAFISFFWGVLNRDTMEMTYVNAGHDPPLLINSAGNIRTLAGTGFCLGMFPSVSYETKSIRIEPDEILCLYTDGIVEGRNLENEEYGTDRLYRQLCECSELPAQDVLNKIYEGVRSFSASDELGDDMTLVIVKKKAAGAPIMSHQPSRMGAGIRGQPLIAPEWKELRVKADLAEIERVRDFLRQRMHGIIIAEEDDDKAGTCTPRDLRQRRHARLSEWERRCDDQDSKR